MSKQSKITKSARGEMCQVRVPGICNHNPETTVYAHLNGFRQGHKASDIHGAYSCSDCHSWLDGGYTRHASRQERDLTHYEGMIRTQLLLLKKGLLKK